ncbi:MAG: tRNA (adenosine(37)-N6)-dimethylallyltransferase MiaA [Firmicutes bacterium]|nr:tRNA (adenosine(37)-N6)-dimethylallyltransferase MiaA [Bacillota bacterium]
MNTELVMITGPTACGKTAVSVEFAKKINGEVISADSMQVYKTMDIGTAKVTAEETQGIPHYLIDELDPDAEFNVAVFQRYAKKYIQDIRSRGKMPVIAGGTGFYINAVLYDNDFAKEKDSENDIRTELQKFAEENGAEALHNILRDIDPISAEKIHQNNIKKVIRAIEFYKLNNRPISEHNAEEKQRIAAYNAKIFVLDMDRKRLYDRIEKRIDIMLEQGLLAEVETLLKKYPTSLVSMQGIGYKEFVPYFNGECTLDKAVYTLKANTRHFAKRQLTWFRHQCPDAVWVDMDKFDAVQAADFIYGQI